MAGVWVAQVPLPASVPLAQVHVMLYSYFPGVGHGEARPYLWRLLAKDRVGIVSGARPTAPSARLVTVAAGVTLDFRLTYKRVRQSGGGHRRADGTRRQRQATPITLTSMPELRQRLIAFAGERGGSIGYVRLAGMGEMRVRKADSTITLPVVDAEGQVLVTDAEKFAGLLSTGGPGTGKAFGCGAWWLPSLMDPPA